jgi:hypothetical protein
MINIMSVFLMSTQPLVIAPGDLGACGGQAETSTRLEAVVEGLAEGRSGTCPTILCCWFIDASLLGS